MRHRFQTARPASYSMISSRISSVFFVSRQRCKIIYVFLLVNPHPLADRTVMCSCNCIRIKGGGRAPLRVFLLSIPKRHFCCNSLFPFSISTKTRLFKYIKNLQPKNKKKHQIKNSDIFHFSAQNIRLWVLVKTASARRF